MKKQDFPIPTALLPFTRRAFPSDVEKLAQRGLHPDDAADIAAFCPDVGIRQALQDSYDASVLCVTFFIPGQPDILVGMGGITAPTRAWCLFAKDFPQNREIAKIFLRACPIVRNWWLKLTNGFLWNLTRPENRRVRRWLKWLGAVELDTPAWPIIFYIQGGKPHV